MTVTTGILIVLLVVVLLSFNVIFVYSLVVAVIILLLLAFVILSLTGTRVAKLESLRKWRIEIFLCKDSVEHLTGAQIGQLAGLIDLIEDSSKRKSDPFYDGKDREFMKILRP
jgi:hypothetical protein